VSRLPDDRLHRARRSSFDAVAEQYADARPPYPPSVFDLICKRVPPPARVLEVGPGPGVATLPLAERGYEVVGVELGAKMARVARRRLAAFSSVHIVHADFHEWEPVPGSFDLVVAASAWHWIDPSVGYARAQAALRPGGYLVLVANHPRPGRLGSPQRRFWDATDPIYRQHAPALVARRGWHPTRLPDLRPEMRRSGFPDVERLVIRWRLTFTPDAYVRLLDTYSDHRTLHDGQQQRLLGAIHCLAEDRFGGQVPREYRTVVYLARGA
jgi:SAM-dependent methyltransferase